MVSVSSPTENRYIYISHTMKSQHHWPNQTNDSENVELKLPAVGYCLCSGKFLNYIGRA